ncbi:hypothetical protein AVEN_98834-1 [Araneus ventricosus]|uniref:Uncharacterized protein n=1 Tax=Araneus ventricosus TaxID=182803 RepID=A0A4Y2PMA1_ARAVE|nr:hypothetical protein AVEN_98834-1 [Araneus ventricosus]
MLLADFQNIKGLPHFGVRWRVFFNTFVRTESPTFIAWSFSQTAWQISKSVSVAATGMFSSMDIDSSYSSFCMLLHKILPWVYDVNSPTRRIMENEGLFTNMQENT